MLFAEIGPDFWMGVATGTFGTLILGVFGTMLLGLVAMNNKNSKPVENEERSTYWWNNGKKPTDEGE